MPAYTRALQVLEQHVESRVAPCAVVEVGDVGGATWRTARGRLTYEPGATEATMETVFDLASLTKVLATATVAMKLVDEGRLDLETRIADLVPAWRGGGRERATLRDLLAHSSGLPGHRPFYETRAGRSAFEAALCDEPLEYVPGTSSIYSDLGFILLGFILEDAGGASLASQTEDAFGRIAGHVDVRFGLTEGWLDRTAPTSADRERRGLVDDRNAEALGGVAAHAGLFGTAGGVGAIARAVLAARMGLPSAGQLASSETVTRFTSRVGRISSRALAWDTMLPSSSCGTLMSERAFGHTGFTGTSLWIDPDAGTYVVLLTNRVYPVPGSSEGITSFRRALHDAVFGA